LQRKAFEYLYINANCLAELALKQLAEELEKNIARSPADPSPLDVDELEAQAMAQLAQLDLSTMMDGFAWDSPESDEALLREFDKLQEVEEPVGKSADNIADISNDALASVSGDFNLDLYLEKAHSTQDKIASRVDDAMALVDMDRIEMHTKCFTCRLPTDYRST